MRRQGFNNADGGIFAGLWQGVSTNVGAGINKISTSAAKSDVKAICGREPILNNKGQHDAWKQCAQKEGTKVIEHKQSLVNNTPLIIVFSVTGLALIGILGYFITSD